MTTYSKELCEHHRTIINHAEADLRCAQLLLAANEHQLNEARKQIALLKDHLAQAAVMVWWLPVAAFLLGITVMAAVYR